ncbi:ead/Ea22-like family protein [Pseudomonas aeruginosa]
MTDINKLKELAERATPGPWVSTESAESEHEQWVMTADQQWSICATHSGIEGSECAQGNAEFIAAANPQAIIGLLERLRLTELKGLMDAQSNMDLIKDIGRLKSQNDLMLNAIVKSRTALMVGRPTSKVAGQKYTEAFAAIVAALEGATQ